MSIHREHSLRGLRLIGMTVLVLAAGCARAGTDPPATTRPPATDSAPKAAPQFLPIEARWCLEADRCIDLEVADAPREQALGLQLRPPLPPLRGMWFPYDPPALARFWMHRTPEPLDMLFVRDGQVIAIETNTQPCPHLPCRSYGPDQAVDGVIELAAGQAEAQAIVIGTRVQLEPLPSGPSLSP
ncbi:DUF192 domain-containing protein [Synechococcus sp. CCY9202]|jgi:uncharacterized membrane protein (UPF0127 family)|nr:DUF192 domain-containing protein [Synechococcus sp. CCY9202]CAK6699742.1 hypothetical protein IFHNHDMJ_02700 [Synechococcus sp. CBW1107]